MQTSDYTLLITSEQYREVAAFWRRTLDDLDDAPEAGSTASAAAGAAPRRRVPVPLGPDAIRAVDALASDSLGRFTVLTAGIALALARYFNRTGTLLRTPLLADDVESALNARREVPLVFTAPPNATLRAFVEDAAARIEQSYSLQDYPLDVLFERERGANPCATAMFSLSSTAVHDAPLAGRSAVHFDLDGQSEGRVEIDFDPSQVEPFLIAGLASVVAATIAGFNDLQTTVGELERVPAEQRERLLREWNRTGAAAPFASAPRLFEHRAALVPEAPALRFGSTTLSYRELNTRANRLAHHLLAAGDTGPVVGIWMDRSPWLVVAVLGVLKAGLAYLPIDADCPTDRLAFMLRDCGVRRLLVDEAKATAAAAFDCLVVHADREQAGATTDPAIEVGASDLAYVIYTSGSTGEPKGCQIEHHSLSNYLRWANDYYWSDAGTGSMGLFTPLSFDLTVPSLFCPLLRGRTLIVYPQEAAIDEVLRRQLEPGSGIDSIKLTPSHIRLLESARIDATDVRLAIVGGEALTPQQVALLHGIDPRIRVINEYGPTEATVGCIVKEIAAGEPIVIGRPIANTQVYVLDEAQRPVAIGIRGELCLGGEGLARGYHARPALDAARFLPNPFVPGSRIYRTGDIGRWLPSGELECFGRLDGQMKIRGHRIEAGEVEAALRRCDGVREAVAIAHAGDSGPELVAYVVTATGAVDTAALRRTLRELLPEYMVPTTLIGVGDLPLTANGKVDKRRLPPPVAAARHAQTYAEPTTAVERSLARIWEEVFRLERIGVDEDFFELGGHSLRAMAMMPRIHEALGVDVSVGDILAHPTIAALAGILAAKAPAAAAAIARVPPAAHYPVSHGQQRLWLINRIDEDSPAYNVSTAFDLSGPLDLPALHHAFDALVERHESLRTIFVEVDDQPRQRILPAFEQPVEHVDLRGDPRREEAALALVQRRASLPFDLGRGPLLRVTVCQLEASRSILALTIHHIISDEWSMRVLVTEAIQLYEGYRQGLVSVALPALPIQYRDYAAWQRRWLDGDDVRGHREYWSRKLAGASTGLALPADRPRPPVQTHRGRHHQVTVDARTGARIRALGAASGASPFMVLVAMVKALLYRYTGQPDIRVGTPIAGRTQAELAGQIGFYVNTLVLRDDVRGSEPFGELLARVTRTAQEAYEHQAFPFDTLVEELDVARDSSRSPLFDVMVTYESETDSDLSSIGVTVNELRLDSGVSKFDLTFSFAESERGIALEVEYNTDLFDAGRISRMTAHLVRLIESALADAATPIERLGLLSPGEEPIGMPPRAAAPSGMPSTAGGRVAVAPRDERELLLAGVLESVLGRPGLGMTDNYFYVGGDSIKAIQVVNRLTRQGWALRVRDLFEAPKLEDLARRLVPLAAARQQEPAAGNVPLTPIQRWFFLTQPEARAHYNQSVMLRFGDRLEEASVRALGGELVRHHDALRLRYRFGADAIGQYYGEPYDPVDVHDLRDAVDAHRQLERLAEQAQAGLDLERGPLARFVLFQMPDGDRLLAVVHHLAVDAVSWRILLDDLRTGLAQSARREPIRLGAPSASFQAWSLALHAHSVEAEVERGWWDLVERTPVCRLPYDADEARDPEIREQRLELNPADTESLLGRVHHAYNTRINDVLCAALARACREWAGPGAVRVDIEAHGRDGLDAVDVSRTVGWFTALYPVVLDIDGQANPGALLTTVKEQLRRTPGRGLGYGLLRGGRPSGAPILFNFLGQFDSDLDGFEVADEPRGPEQGPHARMTHDLEIGGVIAESRLTMTVRYGASRFRDDTVAAFLRAYRDALDDVVAHCLGRATAERTESDFRYRDATTGALVARLGAGRIEDLYPLSPMQQGMLYHSVLAAGAPVYFEQFSCVVRGDLDTGAFRAAWERVIERHPVLRTAFFWAEVEQPVQVVLSHVEAPWSSYDWRGIAAGDQPARLERLAAQDRQRGFDLDEGPLLRFMLVRTADEAYRFYWSSHHIVLDGWSMALVLQEVFAIYHASVAGASLSLGPVRPFGDYIDWLRNEDAGRAVAYWRARLQGFSRPTPLPAAVPVPAEPGSDALLELHLPAETGERIAGTARDHHLTMSTVARGIWALVLAAHAREPEVLFGATVAGRPAALTDVETMVGLFINTLPVRVRIEPEASLRDWLHALQLDQAELDRHAYSALADIQQCSDVPRRTPLFESILIFENYPVDQSLDPRAAGLSVEAIAVVEQTNYPLTLSIVPSDGLLLRLAYDTSRYDEPAARGLLEEVRARFEAFARDPHQRVRSALLLNQAADTAVPHVQFEIEDATADTVRRLAAVLCFRYAANEDLRCLVDGARLERDALRGDEAFGEGTTTPAAAGPAGPADMAFSVLQMGTGVQVTVRSDSRRFDDAFLRRTQDHLVTLRASLAADPSCPIARLEILPEAERRRVLETFNETDRGWGSEQTIAQYFEDQAARWPDRVAVLVPAFGRDDRDDDEVWTYGELNARANQLARHLAGRHGVGPDVMVGVLAERSFEMVLALMAIEKAGGAYVPLDPEYPRELLRFMMEDSGSAVILTLQKFAEMTAGVATPVLCLDTGWDVIAVEADDNLPSRVAAMSLAYAIYTSGSTGRPKGAMNTHRGIANRLLWMQEAYGLTEHDRVLQKTPFSFDVSVWEFFWPLMVGARLVVAKPGGHRDAAYLVGLIQNTGISTLHFVPSMLQAFIEEPGIERCEATLRHVICSGEAITPELLRRYTARVRVPLHNLYGPTEAAVDVTAWACDPAEARSMVPIGTPIANIRLYILDELLQPVPEGVTGELFLGGVGVGRGYLNRPDLTAAKFIADPFRPGPDARLYRTGDLARYRRDGVVDFLGRIDHQVKLRGFRIELGEIESALLSHDRVRECVVVVREDQAEQKRLVAYVVHAANAAADGTDLRAFLHARLPPHMVPNVIVVLDDLPRLTNGKLDRKSLPAPETVQPAARRYVPPRDGVERRLVRIWEQVLGQTAIGVTDDFFDLGGHSILAMKLVSAIQTWFGLALPLTHLLAHPTVERLAVSLQRAGDPQGWHPLVEIKRGASGAPLFLLPGAGGNVIYFHTLARHLTTPRPIYGLQAVGLDGVTPPLESVEAIAELNVREMRRAWPSGPYLLAGHSFGGQVALEMAQQLRRQGQAVGLLAVLDTPAPTFEPVTVGAGWEDAHWLFKIAGEVETFFGVRLDVTLDELLARPLDEQLTLVVERMQRAGAWAPGADPRQLRGYLRVYQANTQAAHVRYAAAARVPLALFKALDPDPDRDPTPESLRALTARRGWGWEQFALGEVAVYEVPGAHLSMLAAPHVSALAQVLDQALAAADAAVQSLGAVGPA
jgi:amino acid adenylation domain-containing protein/non-ribosomal peptide synthase protein (TIGR01720 family)